MSSEEHAPKPGMPAAEPLEDQINGLTERLAQLETENADLRDRHLRAVADLDNFKKRVRREQAENARYGAEPLVRELLGVLDNLERALSHTGDGGQDEKVAEGVALVLKAFQDVLRQHGVTPVEANPGNAFDPARHEAVDRRETDGDPNRIVEVWQRGYQLHDRLLRPARVVVSASRPSKPVSNGHDVENDNRRG
jgi:molecular chaperone GrpE